MFLINDEGWGAVCLKMNHKTRHKPGSLHLTLILHILYSLPLYLWETSFIEVNAVPRESSCDSHYNQLWPYLLLSPLRRCVWRKRGTLQQQPSSFRTGHFSVQLKGEWTDPVCFADADISVLLMNVRQVWVSTRYWSHPKRDRHYVKVCVGDFDMLVRMWVPRSRDR